MLGVIEIPKSMSAYLYSIRQRKYFCKRNVIIGRKFLSDWRENTHAVLSGHRGLPEAKLFTDLPKLKKETSFHPDQWKDIGVSSRKNQVVLPDEVDSLGIQKGRDLVTLLTCTPYMVNTHRLLVTGHRIPYQAKRQKSDQGIDQWKKWKFLFGLSVYYLDQSA